MTDLKEAVKWIAGLFALIVYTILFGASLVPGPVGPVGIVMYFCAAIALLLLAENALLPEDSFNNEMVSDPVKRAKRGYVNGDLTEHEFEKQLEDAMEDNELP